MEKYKVLDHTADAAIEVFGRNYEELFSTAASGMFSLISPLEKIRPRIEIKVVLEGDNLEILLNKWLNELLFIFETKKILFRDFDLKIQFKDDKVCLNGSAKGEKYNPENHLILSDIKMVTFHQLNIKKTNNNYSTKIVFDL